MPWSQLRKLFSFDIILIAILVGLSVLLNQLKILQRWENISYDLESTVIANPVDSNIVIVAIDDKSLKKLGRWPWSRAIHARILDQLAAVGVKAIGMDILFMEPDILHPEHDQLFAEALRRNSLVVLPVLVSGEENSFKIIKPLEQFAEVTQLGHVNLVFDRQGIVRKLDLEINTQNNQALPAMSLAVSRQLPEHKEPSDLTKKDKMMIHFAGPPGHFHQVSYVDVLFEPGTLDSLRDKIVLIGVTAAGLGKSIATPASKANHLMSGIELHANALATIQSGKIIRALQWPLYSVLSLIFIAIPVLLFRFLKPNLAILVALGFSAFTIITSLSLLNVVQIWFPPLPTLLCLGISYPLWSMRKLDQLGKSLFKEHENASATLKAIGEAVITTDKRGSIEFMNPAAEKMLACSLADAKYQPFSEICQILNQDNPITFDTKELAGSRENTETKTIRNQEGNEFAVQVSTSPIHAENGESVGLVYALSDLTEIININRKIAFIASHDSLTGLPNRVLLQDRLQQAIAIANRESLKFAVLFIDLDGFKKINDGMGHASGDLLLQEVAQRLRSWIRTSDTISRWGGDEFIIILGNLTSSSDAADIAIKIIQSLSPSFLINNQEVFVTSSIGISFFPDDGQQPEILLAKSDTAMYSVKKSGRNNFCFYSQGLDNQAKERLVLETGLRQAIDSGELEMYYQPQLDLTTNQLVGAEALIRWHHPDKGLLSPDNFIPLAEEIGLIIPIGEWIIKTVCKQLQKWQKQGLPIIKIAINLSAHQFAQKDLVSIITREIKGHGLAVESLQVEITESMMIEDIDRVIQIMGDLKTAGISIAIDDFGTGYSSLEHLKRFPIDKLKIDKSFVDSVLNNPDDNSIVQAVIALGHNMNMQIIAEGVETAEQANFLRERQCDFGQGYFYSKPIPSHEMGCFIKKSYSKEKLG